MVNSSNQFYSSSGGFSINPLSKYYDSYTYDLSSKISHSRGRLGDATKETLQIYGNLNGGWYDDYSYLPDSTFPWIMRGGSYSYDANAGLFSFYYSSGVEYSTRSARAVVVKSLN